MHPVMHALAWECYQRIRRGEAISALILACPGLVLVHDRMGRTLLHVAGHFRRPEAFFSLISAGADPYQRDFIGARPLALTDPRFMWRLVPTSR